MLVALEGEDVRKCGMTDLFVFFEVLLVLAAVGQMWFIKMRCAVWG